MGNEKAHSCELTLWTMKNIFHTFKALLCLFRKDWIWQWESVIKKSRMRNILHCPGNHTSFVETIMRISDLLSLFSQKLNSENNRPSHKDGIGGREAFCILPWFCPFFSFSPLCLREEDIDSRSDRGKVSQSSSLFFCREEVSLVPNLLLLACSPPPPYAAWKV